MKHMSRFLLWVVFGVVLLLDSRLGYAAVETGRQAPDFALADTYGEVHSIVDFRGKYVVLEWINHDCPFVKKHYESGNMQSLQKEFGSKDVIWLSIASSGPGLQGHYDGAKWNQLTEAKGAMPTAVLLDSNGMIGKLYGAKTTPHMFVIDPEGTVIYQGAIDDTPSTKVEDVEDSTNYVRQALDAAMAGKQVPNPTIKSYGCSVKYA